MFHLIVGIACLIYIWKAVSEWRAGRRAQKWQREHLAPLAGVVGRPRDTR
jgi:hypothetical protein